MIPTVLDSRNLHLMDNPTEPLTRPGEQQPSAQTTETDVADPVFGEPKFLGFCCGPAESCCCGCSLQFAIKAFATAALVLGAVGLMGSITSIGMVDAWESIESLIRCGLVLALGISLWNTAVEVNPRLGYVSSYLLAGICLLDFIIVILRIITVASPAFNDRIVLEFCRNFVNHAHRDPSPEEMRTIRDAVATFIRMLIGILIASFTCAGLLYLMVFYFIWSFIIRAKRGEYFLIAFGPQSLPASLPHSVTPQYGVYYSQPFPQMSQQPNMYPQPQYLHPTQGNQVQQSTQQQQEQEQEP